MPERRVRRAVAPLREQVRELLRQDILTFEFEPGERLVEATLCARFEVSRTVIREVLRQLESEGLVTVVPNHGPVVTELDRADAQALYEIRAALEGLAGSLFARRADAEQRARLHEVVREIEGGFPKAELQERLALKDRFYDVLIDGSGNPMIHMTLRGIYARVQLLRGLSLQAAGRAPETVRELDEIADAAATRHDPEAARVACERHVHNAAAVALRQLDTPRDTAALLDSEPAPS